MKKQTLLILSILFASIQFIGQKDISVEFTSPTEGQEMDSSQELEFILTFTNTGDVDLIATDVVTYDLTLLSNAIFMDEEAERPNEVVAPGESWNISLAVMFEIAGGPDEFPGDACATAYLYEDISAEPIKEPNMDNNETCRSFVLLQNVTAIENLDGKIEMKVFPNPSTDYIYFDLIADGDYELCIFSSNGQLLMKRMINNKEKFNLENYDSGLYFFAVTGNKKSSKGQFIIE